MTDQIYIQTRDYGHVIKITLDDGNGNRRLLEVENGLPYVEFAEKIKVFVEGEALPE
jgi:hypothetical protein